MIARHVEDTSELLFEDHQATPHSFSQLSCQSPMVVLVDCRGTFQVKNAEQTSSVPSLLNMPKLKVFP
jgi:hypothetical protein